MDWNNIRKKYGKNLVNKIRKSGALRGITIAIRNGKEDIPERDIELAIKQVKGKKISSYEWD